MGYIGQSLRRVEDARFLTGQGRYVADLAAPGALHMAVLRSPHAHARILSVDISGAQAALVLTAAELAGIGPLPCPANIGVPLALAERPILAEGIVHHVGQAVAFVFAETPEAARDAAEAIIVDYDTLPAVTGPHAALADGAPQLHAAIPGNLAFTWQKGDAAATQAAIAGAAHVVRLALANQRVTCAPIEPRAALATPNGTLHVNGQAVHGMRRQLAQSLGVPEAELRLVVPDVGGGFGVKNVPFAEHVGLLLGAKRLGRPVRWVAEQAEDFAASAHGRAYHSDSVLALDAAGRFLALQVEAVAELGAFASPNGPACPTNSAGTAFGGGYAIPAIHARVVGAYANTAPIEAYRGAGKPEANHITEMLIEAAGRQTGIPAAELRARNLIGSYPHTTAMSMTIADGQFPANLAAAELAADRPGFAARRAEAAARGKLRGLGVACFMETARGAFGEWARLSVADGRVELALGTHSNGQGHETSMPQIAADQLGLPPDVFDYVQGDTDRIAKGGGHGGARSLHQGGRALVEAAAALIEAARPEAARLLQSPPESLQFAEGRFTAPAGASVALLDMTVSAEAEHDSGLCTFPHGGQVAEVEIDPDTGEVTLCRYIACDDYGTLVNPLLTEGQLQGGLAQGIGQALLERIAYDADGQLLSATFMDYCLPRAMDLPMIEVRFQPGSPASVNPLGVKGVGQAGCISAPQAVMAAVLDALAERGVRELDMPATPEAVWKALQTK
ncbi:xanthine dehydrogenase family protein molybdopterin-binding subunit [Rhodovarius crocodyli]|uniref:Xanthine dehydrogenase family protein molybdopterin-binding subunit n=1 Tax=Rhodovarius crocodyli TaxID=1979269 RepID=A0A437MCI2_9PROT|nr:xanthine dehydrogenase family protein molybdopterin-binding subunit [Rhodovarius crocodyli]RVT95350.1 xanthine dehydrogenase family protein molybdopterin-binding subunit [Rhodovarius crocodyli]